MIGKTRDGNDVSVDAVRLIGTHACVIGNTGSGKTHTIRKVLEETFDDAIHVVFDPEGEFHTLRQGKPYVIVGGPHADMPITRGLARYVVESRTSIIVQFADGDELAQQQNIIRDFINDLMALPRALWKPVFVVIDEAHRFAPQSGWAASLQAICTLMSQGRKRGFTGILATQRLAKLNKNASGECNTWFVGRVGQVTDQRAAANNLGFPITSPEAQELRHLAPGEFWTFGPATAARPALVKVDATRTQHLKLGESWAPAPLSNTRSPRPQLDVGCNPAHVLLFLGVAAAIGLLPFAF